MQDLPCNDPTKVQQAKVKSILLLFSHYEELVYSQGQEAEQEAQDRDGDC